jgi:hypothetical protein
MFRVTIKVDANDLEEVRAGFEELSTVETETRTIDNAIYKFDATLVEIDPVPSIPR